jgi:hypothetical protein
MIGVLATQEDEATIAEFFELFKTPWEFWRGGRSYEVMLCADDTNIRDDAASVTLVFSSKKRPVDAKHCTSTGSRAEGRVLRYRGRRFPIYGSSITFGEGDADVFGDPDGQESALYRYELNGKTLVRVGYNLWDEVATLLSSGQPTEFADTPTLDLHIALLRELILSSGVSLVEIPPVPEGYSCIVCLTHDVDHPLLRRHLLDHTVLGFLYRALIGTTRNWFRRRLRFWDVLQNWRAALKLPLIAIGVSRDLWCDFDVQYRTADGELPSTYFVIPFRDRPGKGPGGKAPKFRASAYGATDIREAISRIVAAGGEVGLHGIDAWADLTAAQEELAEIRKLSGQRQTGVRMHWLYFDEKSPAILESCGMAYDSTVGYRETVGYRTGTAQAYRIPGTDQLLELPMHAMDTALFYPAYRNLSAKEASEAMREMADHVTAAGGCLTINWHDRSLGPERLWYSTYTELVRDLKERGAWFATAGQASRWFRKRRSLAFQENTEMLSLAPDLAELDQDLPGVRVRFYQSQRFTSKRGVKPKYFDLSLSEAGDLQSLRSHAAEI